MSQGVGCPAGASMHSSRVVLNDNLMRGLSDHGLLKKDHATLVRSSVRTRDRAFLFVESSMGFPYTIDASDAPANAEWVAKERCAVRGELWVCNASVMAQLDWYHGVPTVCQRKLVALQGESEPAIMYFLKEQRTIGEIVGDRRKYRSVQPLGDWRAYLPASSKAALESAHTTLPQTKISTLLPGPHAVFSYGSNGVQQMRTRLENPKLQFRPAILPNFLRIFCGSAKRWDNGGVASVVPMPGWEVKGNIAYLSDDELRRLDRFEGTPRDDPYALTARYRRQDVHVLCEIDGQIQTIETSSTSRTTRSGSVLRPRSTWPPARRTSALSGQRSSSRCAMGVGFFVAAWAPRLRPLSRAQAPGRPCGFQRRPIEARRSWRHR